MGGSQVGWDNGRPRNDSQVRCWVRSIQGERLSRLKDLKVSMVFAGWLEEVGYGSSKGDSGQRI